MTGNIPANIFGLSPTGTASKLMIKVLIGIGQHLRDRFDIRLLFRGAEGERSGKALVISFGSMRQNWYPCLASCSTMPDTAVDLRLAEGPATRMLFRD
jgi:hypothetical protein